MDGFISRHVSFTLLVNYHGELFPSFERLISVFGFEQFHVISHSSPLPTEATLVYKVFVVFVQFSLALNFVLFSSILYRSCRTFSPSPSRLAFPHLTTLHYLLKSSYKSALLIEIPGYFSNFSPGSACTIVGDCQINDRRLVLKDQLIENLQWNWSQQNLLIMHNTIGA